MPVHVIRHPLIQHKLGLMRSSDVSIKLFRELASEIAELLTYEATQNLPLQSKQIKSWTGDLLEVEEIRGKKVTVVPILRAGLGMMNGVLNLIPSARISVVGVYRDEKTLQPVPYFEKFVANLEERLALVIDPMLATGGSMAATIKRLKALNCHSIKVIVLVAAPEGINRVMQEHPEIDIYTAAIDKQLNEQGYIVPGLGDAGDKIFGTR